jgi:ribosome-associated protein
MIEIAPGIYLDEREIAESFIRSSGPGGQNVNKVSSAVQLRLDVRRSPSLPAWLKARVVVLAGSKLTTEGVLIIDARRHRTQAANRENALVRLRELLGQAAVRPKRRRATRPTAASRQRRLEGKRRRSQTKGLRRGRGEE